MSSPLSSVPGVGPVLSVALLADLVGFVTILLIPVQVVQEMAVTASIGVAFFPEDALDLSGLIAAADEAMYTAKRAGRNRIAFYATAVATSDSTAPAVPAA